MFSHTDSFVGTRFTASIGEPWDFVSSIGQNKLEGEILSVVMSDRGQPCFLCSISPFNNSGVEIKQVIGVNRYTSSQDLIAVLKSGKDATMNFAFIKSGDEIVQENIVSMLSSSGLTSFLVGSMKLSP